MPPALLETPGWRLERIGWLADPISIEDIDGNKFRVTARHLTRRQCGWIEEARKFRLGPAEPDESVTGRRIFKRRLRF